MKWWHNSMCVDIYIASTVQTTIGVIDQGDINGFHGRPTKEIGHV